MLDKNSSSAFRACPPPTLLSSLSFPRFPRGQAGRSVLPQDLVIETPGDRGVSTDCHRHWHSIETTTRFSYHATLRYTNHVNHCVTWSFISETKISLMSFRVQNRICSSQRVILRIWQYLWQSFWFHRTSKKKRIAEAATISTSGISAAATSPNSRNVYPWLSTWLPAKVLWEPKRKTMLYIGVDTYTVLLPIPINRILRAKNASYSWKEKQGKRWDVAHQKRNPRSRWSQ